MDNMKQICEIKRYCVFLRSLTGRNIDPELAAFMWINKYAEIWRVLHPSFEN